METLKRKKIAYCECGCGQSFLQYDSHNRLKRFVSGHNAQKGERVSRIMIICDYCGIKYYQLPCKLKYEHHFCSNHCRALWCGQFACQTDEYKKKKREIAIRIGSKPPLLKGENHPKWKGGITPKNKMERSTQKYIDWRRAVLAKDNYTCQICGIRGGELSAHHVQPWTGHDELRYDVNNGQCLHYDCHMELHGLKKKTA